QYQSGGRTVAVYPTPTVGMVGVLADIERHATMSFKREGDAVLLLGQNTAELGACEYLARVHGLESGRPPVLDLHREKTLQDALVALIGRGLCDSAHDLSEGGLAVALAEMALTGRRGARLTLNDGIRPDALLYGEAQSRVVVAVEPRRLQEAAGLLRQYAVPFTSLGTVTGEGLELSLPAHGKHLYWNLADLRRAYETPLAEALA
nr:AIR synthase-related protein [Deinococcota bacterium]